jgi:hypothetical protein
MTNKIQYLAFPYKDEIVEIIEMKVERREGIEFPLITEVVVKFENGETELVSTTDLFPGKNTWL